MARRAAASRNARPEWSAFEELCRLSVGQRVELLRLPPCGGRFVGKTLHPMPICCDIAGTVRGSGRSFVSDAKSSSEERRVPLGNRGFVSERLRDEIIRQGEAGAVAGLLVEWRTARLVYWASWAVLKDDRPSVPWKAEIGPWHQIQLLGGTERLFDIGTLL
jgi:hypothetical protein